MKKLKVLKILEMLSEADIRGAYKWKTLKPLSKRDGYWFLETFLILIHVYH